MLYKRVGLADVPPYQNSSKKSFSAEKAVIFDTPGPQKQERGYILQKRPFTKPPFRFLSVVGTFRGAGTLTCHDPPPFSSNAHPLWERSAPCGNIPAHPPAPYPQLPRGDIPRVLGTKD